MSQQIKKKFLAPEVIDYFDNQIDAVEQEVAALEQSIVDVNEKIDSEASRLEGLISDESAARQSADAVIDSKVDQEISDRQAADASLDSRIVPMEEILEFNKSVIFENNAAVVADGQPGVEDAQLRDGWFYENMAAGEKINWYFFDGTSQADIQKQNFSAYAVVTLDKITTIPIMAVYTKPTGTNDVFPGFAHSRYIYSGLPAGTEVGKKYLMFIGEAPAIFPELPRLEIPLSSSQGERLPTEEVFTVSLGTNSGAAVGNVKLVAEHLGVSSPSYKGNVELRIRPASLKKLENETASRIAGDASTLEASKDYTDEKISLVMSNLDTEALDSLVEVVEAFQNADGDINQAITDLASSASSALSAETSAREAADSALQSQIDSLQPKVSDLENFGYDQIVHVSKNGIDTNSGKQHSPFLTISAAMAAITDASPSKRYVVNVAAGNYAESSLALKANVFIVGEMRDSVRITGAVSMDSSFSGSGDHRSGFSNVTLLSAADFNWATVTSAAGKLYFNETAFGSNVNMYGHNNAIAQAQFNSCVIFGNLTISGINVGVFTNNVCFENITLNQHPSGGMATILAASGGHCNGVITQNATVNDFNRRSASFLRHFPSEQLVLNGPSAYADVDLVSQGKQIPVISNGANLIALTPRVNHDLTTKNLDTDNITSALIKPKETNAHNMGDWGMQWFWNFGYVHASTGTDLFLISYGSSFGPDDSGKSIGIYTDGGGLQENVDGGSIELATSLTSGTGVRGKIILDAKEIDVSSKQIKNLADGTEASDAVNKSQLDAIIQFNKESKTVDSSILSEGYVDLAFEAKSNSIAMFVGRLAMIEGSDYSVSVVGGVSRITFLEPMLVPSPEALELGDIIHVTYAK